MSLSLFFVALPAFGETSAECPTLSRNLRLGSEGPDVKVLQQLLNKDPLTRVAPSGLGSAGFESTYFGLKTQNAVKRFQGLYATEVLLPAGLKSASGYVGALTRSKLTKLCSGPATRPTPPSTQKIIL